MSPLARLFTALIAFYRKHISPRFAPRCRYYPSCSAYALQSIEVHGALKGTLLASWRLLRCNPFTKGGVDEVPEKGRWPSKPLGHAELLESWKDQDAARKDSSDNEDQPSRKRNNQPPRRPDL